MSQDTLENVSYCSTYIIPTSQRITSVTETEREAAMSGLGDWGANYQKGRI